MKRILSTVVALGLAAAALVGAPAQAAGKTLTLGAISPVSDWRASSGQLANLGPYYQAVYSTLLIQKNDGRTYAPGLAAKWSYDKTQTVLTLTLRKGVKFTDGTAVDAAAVKTNLDGYSKGLASDASTATAAIDSVTAKGTDTVIIKLKYASSPFLGYLSMTLGMMESPAQIASADAKATPVGAGPYILDKAASVAGSSYVFNANPNYFDKASVKFSTLVIKSISDSAAGVNAIKSGLVDAINILDMNSVASLEASGIGFAKIYIDEVGIFFIDRAGRMGSPWKNLKVRQAVNYAVDRDAALKVFAAGYGKTTQQEFASYNAGYVPALQNTYTRDLNKAKTLMAEAGYPDGFETTMPRFAGTPQSQVDFISDQLAQLGIKVTWTSYATTGELFNAMWAPKFPGYRMTLQRDANDLQLVDFKLSRDAAWNPAGAGDATSDKLILLAKSSTGATQKKALQDLNRYIQAQAWTAPLIEKMTAFAYNKSKVSVAPHAGNVIPYVLEFQPK
jgi:peptide/nickel transport system substrate-binding protein